MALRGILISLEEMNESHLELMVKWRNNPAVSEMMFDRGKFTLEKQKAWFNKTKNDKSRRQFIIIENKGGRPIGAVNLMEIDFENLNCDWGYYIGEDEFRMGGYAVEAEYMILKFAFEELKLHKVYCQTFSYNKKVVSTHKKFGFKIDGTLREHYKSGDSFSDVLLMSILLDEFKESSGSIESLINFFNR